MSERVRDTGHKAGSGSGPRNHADFIWSVADLLRGDYKRSEYGKVILPLTVLRRLDGVLASTKARVLERYEGLRGRLTNVGPVLTGITGVQFYNVSELDLRRGARRPTERHRRLERVRGRFRRGSSRGLLATHLPHLLLYRRGY